MRPPRIVERSPRRWVLLMLATFPACEAPMPPSDVAGSPRASGGDSSPSRQAPNEPAGAIRQQPAREAAGTAEASESSAEADRLEPQGDSRQLSFLISQAAAQPDDRQDRSPPTLEELQRRLQRDPKDPQLLYRVALECYRAGRTAEAAAYADLLLDVDAEATEGYKLRGLLNLTRRRTRDALRDFDRYLQSSPDDEQALAWRAAAHLLNGDSAAAERDADAWASRNPGSSEARYLRGVARARLGRLDDAEADLAAAVELGLDPERAAQANSDLRQLRAAASSR